MVNKKKVLSILLAAMLTLTVAACGGGGAQAPATTDNAAEGLKTVQDGKLYVAMEAAYPPFNWTQTDDSNGAVALDGGTGYANGYDVQMAKKVAEDLGLELNIMKIEWDGLPPAVNSGMVDVIMAGMSPTAERRESIDFSDAYYNSQLVVIVNADGPYADAETLEDFQNARITAQLNTFHYTVIDQMAGAIQLEAMDNFPAMRTALQSGIIDGYVSEKPEGISAMKAISAFKMIEFDEADGFEFNPDDVDIAVGLKKGNDELTKAINESLAKISKEERNQLMDDVIEFQPASAE